MTHPNETPAPESNDRLGGEVTANLEHPSDFANEGATRKGHSNGLKVHSIVFGAIALAALIALLVAFVVIASDRM
ncbi:MAG: hypothetical protein ACJ72L_17040 [Marmoricola sp.]